MSADPSSPQFKTELELRREIVVLQVRNASLVEENTLLIDRNSKSFYPLQEAEEKPTEEDLQLPGIQQYQARQSDTRAHFYTHSKAGEDIPIGKSVREAWKALSIKDRVDWYHKSKAHGVHKAFSRVERENDAVMAAEEVLNKQMAKLVIKKAKREALQSKAERLATP